MNFSRDYHRKKLLTGMTLDSIGKPEEFHVCLFFRRNVLLCGNENDMNSYLRIISVSKGRNVT